MNLKDIFCPNPACPDRGKVGNGNIGVHSQKDGHCICHTCGKTFRTTRGTALYGLKKAHELFVVVTTLLAYGCPVAAIVAAFGLDARTVRPGCAGRARGMASGDAHLRDNDSCRGARAM